MKTELLSPAGDLEAAYAAFYYGADAIYLGLSKFSARAEAINFTPEQLDEITAYAHAHNKKVYVTINTLAQENELPDLLKTLSVCDQYHVDALIIQDLGTARIAQKCFPNLILHGSTQMAIHNVSGAKSLEKMGFKRVVLARELSLSEIKKIERETNLEIEVFIHGALCYSYSGLCYFSSIETARSANRGKCVYSCRDVFQLNEKTGHLFSMKDLALETDVLKLKGFSLKIEGRKKNALYVAAVTDYYRRILDTGKADVKLTDNLKQIFARPWTKLHFNGKNKEVIEPDFVGHRGLLIGHVDTVFQNTLRFKPTHSIERYDGIQIDVPGSEKPFGFSAEHLSVNGKNVFEVPAGKIVHITLPQQTPFIPKGSPVYLASSTAVKRAYPYIKPKPNEFRNKNQLTVHIYITKNQVTATANDLWYATIEGSFDLAQKPEAVKTSIQKAFEKTDSLPYQLENLLIQNEENLFIPMSLLNELRRKLYEQIDLPQLAIQLPPLPFKKDTPRKSKKSWIIKTDQPHLFKSIDLSAYSELIITVDPHLTPENISCFPKEKIRLSLPLIIRNEETIKSLIQLFWKAGYHKWEIGNLSGLSLLPHPADISFDYTISILNTQAMSKAFELKASRITFSPEDTYDNIKTISAYSDRTALIVYQDTPLFISANCIRNNPCATCNQKEYHTALKNRHGRYELISKNCQTTVIKESPFYIIPKALELPVGFFRIDFCHKQYTTPQIKEILQKALKGVPLNHTTAHHFEKQFA